MMVLVFEGGPVLQTQSCTVIVMTVLRENTHTGKHIHTHTHTDTQTSTHTVKNPNRLML